MNLIRSRARQILLVFTALLLVSGAQTALAETSLTRVENDKVCMVTNKVFEKTQIPVAIEGKTYYGCCEMCKGRLEKESEARIGVDPVSGKAIDKSQAVIGAAADGSVFYFENDANLKAFKR